MIRVFLVLLAAALPASADIFIVRHAEKAHPKEEKSLLSKAGHARAKELSRALSSVPLKAVYCTEYDRTLQTAEPAAKAQGLSPIRTSSEDMKGLAAALRARAREDVLVVGHSDTVPELLAELGVEDKVSIAEGEFDNLFIVSLASASARMHRLRYGAR